MFELNKFSLTMLRCRQCGIVFTCPQPSSRQVLQRYAEHWFEGEYLPSYGIDPSKPQIEHLAAHFAADLELIERFRSTGKLLDVGAGAGLFLFHAQQRGWQPHGVEISEYGPSYARRYFNLEITQGTLDSIQYPDQYFDVVMLQDTIEHVPDPFRLLGEIYRIVRVGGAVVISTPNYESGSRRVFRKHWALISPAEHLFLFTMDSLLYLFQRSGFAAFQLESSADLHEALYHPTSAVPPLVFRRAVLKMLKQHMPRSMIHRLSLGTELHAVGVKKE